ncbi:MAG: NAD-dependent malic enzyme [Gammaproteobacteria bacterium RIFCSPHIGHO2_12_FULL_41_20]|nr:MAG: NAD-dependent malic enzyme [Gammaproteobacteria bacterium RIFCSPHIGHO2_12_FULL_41_20]
MLELNILRDDTGKISSLVTCLQDYDLLHTALLNKGSAFTQAERQTFLLAGLLPHNIETLEQQSARAYLQYQNQPTNLSKNIYLNWLHDHNETLFYRLVTDHLEQMLPIIYTPTISQAVEYFSLEYRNPRGLYISYTDQKHIEKILDQQLSPHISLMVVTDGEGVLGIGDQGIGGMCIANSKLMVYILGAGVHPYYTLPVQLDMGTNNQQLLNDPRYLGWRHERISGQAYDDFIEQFVQAVKKKLPHVFLHWEDLGRDNARRILERYQNQLLTMNGDIQGTGSTTVACVLAGTKVANIPLTDHRIVIFGAGTAGIGIADELTSLFQYHGLSAEIARTKFWLIDKPGLLTTAIPTLSPGQKPYARQIEEIQRWQVKNPSFISLEEVIHNIKPTILIGCSAVASAFTQASITAMATYVERPIIMPLSNPTHKSEATPEELLHWTEGKAIIAIGGPFPDVTYKQRRIRIAQSNNAFAFPGIGLGVMAVKANKLTNDMMRIAAQALNESSPVHQDKNAPLLPKISEIQLASHRIAHAVATEARQAGCAQIDPSITIDTAIQQISWEPKYYPYRLKKE